MFSLLKKKFGQANSELKKIENTDIMEAIVGSCLLMASISGGISDEEMESLDKQISSNPSMEHFGAQIGREIARFEKMLDAGPRIGKMRIFKEIKDIANNPEDAEEVFVNVLTVAEADGEIDDKEMELLTEIGKMLNVRLADYGLAA